MGEEYRYKQVGILTILMELLTATFTAFVFSSAINSAEGQDATLLKLTGIVVAGVFIVAFASFYSFTIQIADGNINKFLVRVWGRPEVSSPRRDSVC